MGALHAGHQSLIKIAKELSDEVVLSVFVNPLQFENKEDLVNYPKTPEIDEQLAKDAGATLLWRPQFEDIYPGNEVKLSASEIGARFEGASRPGHFDGVLTVVNRLFDLVRPKYAIFGEKDFQQLFLIRKMTAQRHPDIEIIAAPTIREESGLALSSRNVRLSSSGLRTAQNISKALHAAATQTSLADMNAELARLSEVPNFKLDYAEIIDEETFDNATVDTHKARAIVAGWVEGVRLIDNMAMVRTLVRT
jgi:pantoate--beta-alanine ligase